jgi:hypothetical protein
MRRFNLILNSIKSFIKHKNTEKPYAKTYTYMCLRCGNIDYYNRMSSGYKCQNDGSTMQRVDI